MSAADGQTFTKTSFLENAATDAGRNKGQPVLIWLDCLVASTEGVETFVHFQLCKKPAGGKREVASQYTAVLRAGSAAPEGMVVCSLRGSSEHP
jgi:hypothetical protein